MKSLTNFYRSAVRETYRLAQNPTGSIKGIFRQIKANYSGIPIVFKDEENFSFYQYPGDDIYFNYQRKNVGDSSCVRKYLAKNVNPGDLCIDVGACIGSVSVPLWEYVGHSGLVISIEADPNNIDRLKKNIALNSHPNDYVLNIALTDKDGTVQLRRYLGNNGWQTIGNPTFASSVPNILIEVETTSMDSVLRRYGITSVDFVKIDVEGAEPIVLNGMRSLIKEGRVKQVIFEVNHLMLEGTHSSVDELMNFWKEQPFSLYRIKSDGERTLIEGISDWPENLIGDCVAVFWK